MKIRSFLFSLIALTSAGLPAAKAGDGIESIPPASADEVTLGEQANWMTGEGVAIGGILFPSSYLRVAGGGASGAAADRLAVGAHDPFRDGVTFQGLDVGMSLRAGEYLEGFANVHAFVDEDDELDAELEEAFLKLRNMPGGLELRGGLMLSRFGFINAQHQHSWDFVDTELGYGRFLGDHHLSFVGGELTWNLPTRVINSALSIGIGQAEAHDHDHEGHGDEHEHGGLEGEAALFNDFMVTASWLTQVPITDFHRFSTVLSYGYGDNEFGRNTHLVGAGVEYQWRARGLQPGGRSLRWRNEVFYRHFGAVMGGDDHGHGGGHEAFGHEEHGHHDDHEEDHHEADHHEEEHHEEDHHEEDHHEEDHHDEGGSVRRNFDDVGVVSALVYGVNDRLDLGVRGEYVSGVGGAEGLDERFRVSPNATFWLNDARTMFLRVQYNYDHSNEFGDAHSVWGQFGLNWGGPEVR